MGHTHVTNNSSRSLAEYVAKLRRLDQAAESAKGCPVLHAGGTVTVYEIYEVM